MIDDLKRELRNTEKFTDTVVAEIIAQFPPDVKTVLRTQHTAYQRNSSSPYLDSLGTELRKISYAIGYLVAISGLKTIETPADNNTKGKIKFYKRV